MSAKVASHKLALRLLADGFVGFLNNHESFEEQLTPPTPTPFFAIHRLTGLTRRIVRRAEMDHRLRDFRTARRVATWPFSSLRPISDVLRIFEGALILQAGNDIRRAEGMAADAGFDAGD
jgi:hypothetical protein